MNDHSVMRALVVDAITDRGEGGAESSCRGADAHRQQAERKYHCARWHSFSLDTSATSGGFAAAVMLDYLRNMEERNGRPVGVCQGDLMPDETRVLPEAEVLQCSGRAQHAWPPDVVGGPSEIPS